jgi:NAD(P)-dependent dehydrogenase (short-subunit alcohol dehydrogenase family)
VAHVGSVSAGRTGGSWIWLESFGRLDVLVNNAGFIGTSCSAEDVGRRRRRHLKDSSCRSGSPPPLA